MSEARSRLGPPPPSQDGSSARVCCTAGMYCWREAHQLRISASSRLAGGRRGKGRRKWRETVWAGHARPRSEGAGVDEKGGAKALGRAAGPAGVRGSARGPSRNQHGQLSFRRGLRTAIRLWACLPGRPRPTPATASTATPPRSLKVLGLHRALRYYNVGGPARERLTPTYWRRSSNRSCPRIDAAPSAPDGGVGGGRELRHAPVGGEGVHVKVLDGRGPGVRVVAEQAELLGDRKWGQGVEGGRWRGEEEIQVWVGDLDGAMDEGGQQASPRVGGLGAE
eukprot:scaffold14632_cov119-Isochrysis_galbana.AAC.3